MEKPTVEVESLWQEVVIRYNPATREYSLTGCDKNAVVAWGMLEYALARVRRFLVQGDLAQEFREASRIALPGGPLA